MIDSIFGFFANHLPFSRKRRASESNDDVPVKQIKYNSSTNICSINIMESLEREKENKDVEIIEDKSPGWIAPRRSIRHKHLLENSSSTPIPSTSKMVSPIRSHVSNRTRRIVDSAIRRSSQPQEEVQVLGTFRTYQSTVKDRLFGPFRPTRPRFGLQSKNKALDSTTMRKFLEEKMTYKRLLDMHQHGSLSVLTFPELKVKTPPRKQLEVIDLETELKSMRVNRARENIPITSSSKELNRQSDDVVIIEDKKVTPVRSFNPNSLDAYLKLYPSFKNDVDIKQIISNHAANIAEKRRLASLEEAKLAALKEQNEKNASNELEERMRYYMKITEIPILEIEDEEEYKLPELSSEEELMVKNALGPGPGAEVLSDKFDIKITRKDMSVFKGLNWLNDEVINFYMNLLMDRGKKDSMPKVYAFNTFFYQNMVNGRYASLRRWTKKVDLFTFDLVFVPVHLGMHWCMSVIDFQKKEVRYYDSMGSENNKCLSGLLSYLQAESLDKKKVEYDTSDWTKVNVGDIPQQMNGSDCGVFSCIFAEHIGRNAPFKFSQEDMPYFRKKMALEILKGNLIT